MPIIIFLFSKNALIFCNKVVQKLLHIQYVLSIAVYVWRETLAVETLVNLVNDSQFAKFISAKFYPVKESLM